ncbi:MAG: 1-acyl-sn-glycerol-3-phosphate acyltransferase [Candidatus Promineifilaceae bacterium]
MDEGQAAGRGRPWQRLLPGLSSELLDPETLKGAWYMTSATLSYQGDMLKRRLRGQVEVDAWGLDADLLESIRPALNFFYKYYWRIETNGIENIPAYGPAVLVSYHSGQYGWVAAMIMSAVFYQHPAQRLVRCLYPRSVGRLPLLPGLLARLGQAPAEGEAGAQLLAAGELICAFPEVEGSVTRLFRRPYTLPRFGQSDFVRIALEAGAPLIPTAIVGAEPNFGATLGRLDVTRRIGLANPAALLNPPSLLPLGAPPLPTRWKIAFGPPLELAEAKTGLAADRTQHSRLADEVRAALQGLLDAQLARAGR